MRLLFQEGKQRELIFREKNERGITWKELADILSIREGKLHAYFYEEVFLPKEIFEKLSFKEKFRKFILEEKEEGWGQIKGGNKSAGKTKKIFFPDDSIELAEFFGIMLGDGNLTKKRAYKVGTYQIRIVGDSRFDRDYLLYYVRPLIKNLFSVEVSYFRNSGQNAFTLVATGKNLAEFLESKGLKAGDKIRNRLKIPDWIINDMDLLAPCLRGLFDTDGSVYKLPEQNVYQITFTNHNPFLLRGVRKSLLKLGIGVSKISDGRKFYITKKTELRKFLNDVGFRNPKHLNKVKMWNLAP